MKKYFILTSLWSPTDDVVRVLLEGKHDIEPHRVLSPGANVPRFHDAAGRAGHNEPVLARPSLFRVPPPVGRPVLFLRVRADPNTVTLRLSAVRAKDLEGVTQLAQCPAENLQIAASRAIGFEFVGRFLDPLDQVGNPLSVVRLARVGRWNIVRCDAVHRSIGSLACQRTGSERSATCTPRHGAGTNSKAHE